MVFIPADDVTILIIEIKYAREAIEHLLRKQFFALEIADRLSTFGNFQFQLPDTLFKLIDLCLICHNPCPYQRI